MYTRVTDSGWPKYLAEEYPAPVPAYVSAAAHEKDVTPIYLLCEYTLFVYNVVGGSGLSLAYSSGGQFDVRGSGGLIQNAPCGITAMNLDHSEQEMVVFCGFTLYHYKVDTAVWTNHGKVKTPCDP